MQREQIKLQVRSMLTWFNIINDVSMCLMSNCAPYACRYTGVIRGGSSP